MTPHPLLPRPLSRHFAATLLAAALLTGCAGFPDPGPPLQRTDPATLGATDAAIAWPSSYWWRQYDDPVLAGLIDKALIDNPNLQIAEAR